MEYVVQLNEQLYLGSTRPPSGVLRSLSLIATSLQNATVFKSRSRADGAAKAFSSGTVVPFWGRPSPAGMKSFVPAKTPLVNRSRPYRSI